MTITLLILSVVVGVLLGSFFGKNEKFAKQLLILSAGFLITICLNEVFPQVYAEHHHHHHGDHHDHEHSHTNMGIFVIAGVILQMLLESLTKGFEHGHIHHHEEEKKQILPYALMFGLFIHAFIEGIPLASEHISDAYLMGIVVHNIPISFVLGAFLFQKKTSMQSVLIVTLFALSSPLGMILGQYFNPDLQPYFLAIVGGIFIHISSVIIFESNKNHKMDWGKIFLVLLGVGLAYLTHLGHSH